MILLGAYTRLTDAGLSCPDWPNCFGFITAPHTPTQIQSVAENYPLVPLNVKKAWTEMTHRYFAMSEGILILILVISMLRQNKSHYFKTTFICFGLLALLGLQVVLGMLTVTEKLKPIIVLSHLLTGLSILSFLWWLYLDLQLQPRSIQNHNQVSLKPWIWGAFFIIVSQITLGGWVSTHYAGLACIDFPYCNGNLIPKMQWGQLNSDLISIHMLHRFGAFITGTYFFVLALFLLKRPAYQRLGFGILALIILQITLGILNVIWLRPVWIALFHHAMAILLLLTTLTLLIKAHAESQDNRYVFLNA